MPENKSKNIVAIRDGDEREFDKQIWDSLPEDKYGWKQKASAPEEVKNLQTGGPEQSPQKQIIPKPDEPVKTEDPVKADEPTKVNAAELAKQIYDAPTAEAVDALLPAGETRVTVLKAVEERKKQLSETK